MKEKFRRKFRIFLTHRIMRKNENFLIFCDIIAYFFISRKKISFVETPTSKVPGSILFFSIVNFGHVYLSFT